MRDQPGRPAILRQMLLALWMMLAAAIAAATAADSPPVPAVQLGPPQTATVDASTQRIDELRQQLQIERQLLDKDLQALGARMDAQEKRIDDQAGQLSNVITLFDVMIAVFAVLLGAASLATYASARNKAESEARDAAQKWFSDNATTLSAQIKNLENEAQAALGRIEVRTNQVMESADRTEQAMQAMQASFLQARAEPGAAVIAPPPSPALDDAARALQKKSPHEYSFQDWNTLAFAAYQAGDKEGAARHWQSAAALGGAPESVAKVLMMRGIALGELGRAEDSVTCYDDLIRRFGEATTEALQVWVARALVNRGAALGQLKRFDEEIASYGEVIQRFGESATTALQEQVAMALVNKGAALGRLGCLDEAVTSSEEAIHRFGAPKTVVLQQQVAKALVNKGAALDQLGRNDEAIASYDQIICRFGDSPEPELRERVAQAREQRKKLQPEADK